ncbi:GH24360 [Drosophila grimshawi]|uniref:GH24360 n=1 Tax=Drosophila grimshawi TaxID=7222 RepID=B4JMB6_DROGR|nr:GH24360 [Drosophila grimshawi]
MLEHFFECAASEVKGVYQDKRVVKQFPYICECIRIVNCSVPINLCNVVKAYTLIDCLNTIPRFLDPLRSRFDFFSLKDNFSGILLESDNLDVHCHYKFEWNAIAASEQHGTGVQ